MGKPVLSRHTADHTGLHPAWVRHRRKPV